MDHNIPLFNAWDGGEMILSEFEHTARKIPQTTLQQNKNSKFIKIPTTISI